MRKKLEGSFLNKKILITGHTGFKGSWLSVWLRELGAEVIGYALDPYTENDNFVRSNLSRKITDIRGDVRDIDKLSGVFKKYKPEIVFHLAAQPLVRESYINPKDTFDINIGGTVNLFECCRESDSVTTIINVTTDKCYENIETERGYSEEDRMGGYDPYSASKGCSELVTSSYRRSFFNPDEHSAFGKALSSARAGNVIGGGDWAKDRVFPDSIRSLVKGEKILVRNPMSTRPWQLVLEPLGGYLILAAKMISDPGRFSGAWNFGPELQSVVPVKNIVEKIIEYWGAGEWYTTKNPNEPHEAELLALDISKAKKELNWSPKYSAEKAVEETVSWYKSNLKNEDMFQECVDQINNYMDKQS